MLQCSPLQGYFFPRHLRDSLPLKGQPTVLAVWLVRAGDLSDYQHDRRVCMQRLRLSRKFCQELQGHLSRNKAPSPRTLQ